MESTSNIYSKVNSIGDYSAAIKHTRDLIHILHRIYDNDFKSALRGAVDTEDETWLDELTEKYIISTFKDIEE